MANDRSPLVSTRRGFLGGAVAAGVAAAARAGASPVLFQTRGETMIELPPLPYGERAHAPHISQETISFHYGKHHKTYVDNLNKLVSGTGSKVGAFLTGMFSQLVLLGTTYIQLSSTERLGFFVVIFLQGLVTLGYGIVIRSRSLLITPIIFIVLSVITVVYGALKGISTVILIGCTGIVLLLLGILAVVLRERLVKFGDRWSSWRA